ncbi:hypothetical protein [Clostridium vincentii]|uniref:Uncharacterized protein n=1 Tax=Clostridium vincentii TaxID=52704 RepID=A0A2T0B8W0_9CLOT|nr:hypothetical protein [Clostridium vincentii]PRR80304.1 hypothetical protein CLVI_30940 [Clostridium vincentii]
MEDTFEIKKDIRTLIILNFLAYINNFLFSYGCTLANDNLRGNSLVFGIWALSPYIFLVGTSFIIATDNKKEYKIFKKEAIADWIIRFIACCVVFRDFNFKFLSFEYITQQGIVFLLLMINIILEIRMYKKAMNNISIEEDFDEKENISEGENLMLKAWAKQQQ